MHMMNEIFPVCFLCLNVKHTRMRGVWAVWFINLQTAGWARPFPSVSHSTHRHRATLLLGGWVGAGGERAAAGGGDGGGSGGRGARGGGGEGGGGGDGGDADETGVACDGAGASCELHCSLRGLHGRWQQRGAPTWSLHFKWGRGAVAWCGGANTHTQRVRCGGGIGYMVGGRCAPT